MSARYLKKVLQQQESQDPPQLHSDNDEQEEEEEEAHRSQLNGKPKFNPFDLLNEDDDEPQEDEPETNDEPLTVLETKANVVSTSNNQKSKKKKKKKGKEGASSKAEKSVDEILEEFHLEVNERQDQKRGSGGNVVKGLNDKCVPFVLQVDPKYLNADHEMRRIFGSKVVKSFEKSNQQSASSSRMVRGGRRGAHNHRKSFLVTPGEHWPRWDGSLNMELVHSSNGYHDYRYVQTSGSLQAQSAFEAAKALHDLNAIASVLMHYPYHLDSLITMADYFKFVGEHQMSADAISKCLYALECAWPPAFNPFKGDCQVKYSHETNKPLFVALFTHMKSMDRRGCHRASLEVCKFLLSLDTDDPMGAMFCIDCFALRAEENAWLERFADEYKSDNSLWLFPNFSYSLAISRLYLEKEESSKGSGMDNSKSTSIDLMKQALLLHPPVLKKLVAKVPLKERVWTDILKSSFFQADEVGIPSLDHLINIYVESNHIIWRLPELQKLLREAAQLVIETLRQNGSDKNDWACVRQEAFSSDKNEYSHLLVSDFSYTLPAAAPENLQLFVGNARMEDVMRNEQQFGVPNEGIHAPRDVANRNPLAVLFESMLPWAHYGDGEDVEEEN